ncbi:sensor domain-containing diguanylate cyclase [[Clostridium] innocuum]|uniref:sensor domain-containing diguanylate cyclase n=1 Tax=Clostridium innocuum TaxID=1522 RepID=UPI000C2FE685|nr:sensor domain-containing diguanylate cyclase [[Clostridium] innocuum]MCR0172420.1 diguanylate cyclase [[Clostridium] innocuum]MCR0641366.1 diguanylate cyclase [[Clostridium] innocuum]
MPDQNQFWESLDKYRYILDSLPNPVIVTDMDKIVRYINVAARAIVPPPYEKLLNQPCSNFHTPYCHTKDCCIQRFLRNEKGAIQSGPGDIINRVDISYLRDALGNPIGYINVSTDVRELMEVQRQLKISQERYEIALQQARTALWEYDIREHTIQRIDNVRGQFSEIFPNEGVIEGVPDALIAQGILFEDSIREIEVMYSKLKEGYKKVSGQLHMRNRNGEERWVEIRCTTIFDEAGRAIKAIGISKDISEQKRLESSYQNERKLQEIMNAGFLSVFEVNITQNRMILIDKEAAAKLSSPPEEGVYDEILQAALSKIHPDFQKKVYEKMNCRALHLAYMRGIHTCNVEYRLKRKGCYHWINASIQLLKKDSSADIFARVFLKDIQAQKEKEEKLQKEVHIDALTGAYNRKGIITHIEELLRQNPEAISACVSLDIDNFKEVNDTFGHLYGDAVLSETAKKIQKLCRSDTLIGRLGGDEFVAFFPRLQSEEVLMHAAERLQSALVNTYTSGSHMLKTSVSMGISFYPRHGTTFTELYDKADIAMYHCKRNGKNGWTVYHDTMERCQQIMEKPETDNIGDMQLNKPFEGNIGEYIFRILYRREKTDPQTMRTVLELIAHHYDMQYFYVMDFNRETQSIQPLLSWSEEDKSLYELLQLDEQKAALEFLETIHSDNDRILFLENCGKDCFDRFPKEILNKLAIFALVHMSVPVSNQHDILIGLANTRHTHSFSRNQRTDIRTIFEVIVTFLKDQQQREQQKKYTDTLISLLNNLGNSIYVIDPHSYQLIYFNQSLMEIFPKLKTGEICHKVFREEDTPCKDCPIRQLSKTVPSASADIHNAKLNADIQTTAAYVEWYDHQKYVLLSGVDVTRYKK